MYAKMLLPILAIRQDIDELDKFVYVSDGKGLNKAEIVLSKPVFEKNLRKSLMHLVGLYLSQNVLKIVKPIVVC